MVDPTWQRVMDEIARRHPKQAGRASTWLAAEIGVTVQAVNNWKARGLPPHQHPEIARALGWSVDQLLGLAAPPQDPWPFEGVPAERFNRLSERQKGMVELAMIEVMDRIEASAKRSGDGL